MKCQKPHKDILSFAEGILSGDEVAAVEKHLEGCETCRTFLNELKGVLKVIEAEKVIEENPFFYTRVESAMLRPEPAPAFALRRLVPTMVALLFFAGGVYAGINIGSLYGTGSKSNEMLVYETKQYIDDLSQEPIESFIINLYSETDDTK
ncbi:MAG: zf-HC2 domain-containing protein [Bacteroidales bacterium]|nr:zf-HC2 domain-containing protein [Bacteroidales bacterium]